MAFAPRFPAVQESWLPFCCYMRYNINYRDDPVGRPAKRARQAAPLRRLTDIQKGYQVLHLKIRKVGNSLGAVFPREALNRMGISEGDEVFMIETQDGYQITPYDPEFDKQMRVAEEGMARYRNTLRVLAK